MESDFNYEFYNAGMRIDEHMRFSISASSAGFNSDGNDTQSLGYWHLHAPRESFFFVPAVIQSGLEEMRVNFAADIKRRFGKQGVVLVDAKWKPENEDPDKDVSEYAVAPTRELAQKRAEEIWQLHLKKIVEQHLADCQNAMAAGGAPRAAAGFTKKAFKILGIADPGEQYFAGLKDAGRNAAFSGQSNDVLLTLQQQNQTMMALVVAIASGQKVDPELLKALAPQPGKAPIMPVTSGIATGEIKKPVEFDSKKAGLDVYDHKTAGRKERAAAAEKALTNS